MPEADPIIQVSPFPPHALAYAPHGRTFLAMTTLGTVELYDSATGKEVRRLLERSDERTVTGIALAPDGRAVAAVGSDGTAWVWETATGGERRRWQIEKGADPEKPVSPVVAFSTDGRILATSETGGGIRLWHLGSGQEVRTFAGHRGRVTALSFAAGGRLLSVSQDGTALVWDAAGLKPETNVPLEKVEAEAAWKGLDAPDPAKGYQTLARLMDTPGIAIGLLRERLKPAVAAEAKHIDQLIGQLNDDEFTTREKATEELARLGPQAERARARRRRVRRRPRRRGGLLSC